MNEGLAKKVGLAPMEGVSDFVFRLWIYAVSQAPFSSTPFLRVTDSFPKKDLPSEFIPELLMLDNSLPYRVVPQIMTQDARYFIRAAKQLLPYAPFVDLNCGCPSSNAVGGGAGSSLLLRPQSLAQMIRICLDELGPKTVSVKIRTGFHAHHELETIMEALSSLPIHHLTIHGRSRPQRYDGFSRWDLISWAARHGSFPVAASGDITSLRSLTQREHYLKDMDHVIIGRGALRNPWIFSEIREGRSQSVCSLELPKILACLGLLYEARSKSLGAICEMLSDGSFFKVSWQERYDRLLALVDKRSCPIEDLSFERFAMGRIKMIWNYMRSSMPWPLFDPKILRSKGFPQFVAALNDACSDYHRLPLDHQSELDWVYTSRKKPPAETAEMFP